MKLLPAPTANPCAAALGGGEPLLHTNEWLFSGRNAQQKGFLASPSVQYAAAVELEARG